MSCGTGCQSEQPPEFAEAPDDLALDENVTRDLFWYHSSTHPDWPDRDFDPMAELDPVARHLLAAAGPGSASLQTMVDREQTKALHVGTYEAAIENVFRRIADEGDSDAQFFRYRVRLRQDCVIEPGVQTEPTDFAGNAYLADTCGDDVNVLRYVNVHEDASRISLAIYIDAIDAVQRIPIPRPIDPGDAWIIDTTARLVEANSRPAEPVPPKFQRYRPQATPALVIEARDIIAEASKGLPANLRDRFGLNIDPKTFPTAPERIPTRARGLVDLVTDSGPVFCALDAQGWRTV
ncbi:hypothetical protein [Leifsonia aquatica]|uniref:hypothetical protein n=1 Tax=Leifsonia aquatica TaxID=144185 RepID=UPI000693F569|nr:hypothetical protein [Leifsonia aquatica]